MRPAPCSYRTRSKVAINSPPKTKTSVYCYASQNQKPKNECYRCPMCSKSFHIKALSEEKLSKSVLENGSARAVRETANAVKKRQEKLEGYGEEEATTVERIVHPLIRLLRNLQEKYKLLGVQCDILWAQNGTAMLVVQRDDLIRKETYRRDLANEFMNKLGHIRVFSSLTGVE
ncbi:hypothetical protein Tco_1393018 [Tanacetum coccineum]